MYSLLRRRIKTMQSNELLRHRKINANFDDDNDENFSAGIRRKLDRSNSPIKEDSWLCRNADTSTYHLTRIILVRFLGFIYAVAFLIAFNQNRQLLGSNGLKPANKYMKQIKQNYFTSNVLNFEQNFSLFLKCPTLLWFVDWTNNMDTWLDIISFTGLCISTIITFTGSANSIIMFALWLLYHSIVNIGQIWYSFGWESQLLESGFVAIFLVPLFSLKKLNFNSPPSFVCILLYRWLIVRIMLGAGLIKIRGDKCWLDLTCMNYHYETQPVPNPISYYMHQEPEQLHQFEVLVNHFIELIVPFFILVPYSRWFRMMGGSLQIIFQVVLIISGNLSFLNWLTILPSLACFDDRTYQMFFNRKSDSTLSQLLKQQYLESINSRSLRLSSTKSTSKKIRQTIDLLLFSLVFYLSLPVVSNLISSKQVMNTSFEPFRIVNTYGAFGSITKIRHEVIFKGTHAIDLTENDGNKVVWKEYEFHCKPGSATRTPCLISPYHYRLDWLMWFAAFQRYEQNPWLFSLSGKFLLNDKVFSKRMIAHNPFLNDKAPKYVKADLYLYKFTPFKNSSGQWWSRKYVRSYMPALSFDQLEQYVKDLGWKYNKKSVFKS